MPFGNKNDGAVKALRKAQEEIGFTFTNGKILPSEQEIILRKVYRRNSKFNSISEEEMKIENEKIYELTRQLIERLQLYEGKIHPFVESDGGSKTFAKGTTEYVVMEINNVLIFEPLGQPDNATFIGRVNTAEDRKRLAETLKVYGRDRAVKLWILYRVFHKRTDSNRYDYENGHILDIMDYAYNQPNEFLNALGQLMNNQESCSLETVSQSMPDTVDKVVANIGEQVAARGIKGEEVAKVGSNQQNANSQNVDNNSEIPNITNQNLKEGR